MVSKISNLEDFLFFFPGKKIKTSNGYNVQCPAHDDQNPSLSISLKDDRILLHCHVGCECQEILRSIGLTEKDLFIHQQSRNPPNNHHIVATYNYVDEHGQRLFQTVRKLNKQFSQRQPGKHNQKWIWNLKGVRRVLYRLPELIKAVKEGKPIFIVEGEKDVDKLLSLGFSATTNPQGAKKWRNEYSQFLKGADVIILPDNDRPGQEHARQVSQKLVGITKSIKIVNIPGLLPHGDVSDYFNNGGTVEDLLKLVKETKEIEEVIEEKPFEFWCLTENKKGDVKPSIDLVKLIEFLEINGFKRFELGKQGYMFVQIEHNIVREVKSHHIKSFVLEYVKTLECPEQEEIYHALIKAAHHYFSIHVLEAIAICVNPNFNRSTKDKAYFYFKNCYVEVKKECSTDNGYDIKTGQYKELSGLIWKSQILDREFKQLSSEEWNKCEYARFYNAITNHTAEYRERFHSFVTATGYLLHGYKSKTSTKAVICVDEKIPGDDSEANGGTGKGIFFHGIRYLKNTVIKDGKTFNPTKRNFPYQDIDLDTEILVFDDVRKKFPLDDLFSMLVNDWQIEKKNRDIFTISFEDTPKIIITTNFTVLGQGASYDRRRFELEFSSYYNEKYTPEQEFGHILFDDWDRKEWNRFDHFMINCCGVYLIDGLESYQKVNLEKRRLIDATCQEFADFAEENLMVNREELVSAPRSIQETTLVNRFVEEHRQYEKFEDSPNTFYKWLRCYAKSIAAIYRSRRSGKKRYATLTQKEDC